ncbi:het domain protein, partial [Moniliophthora roreri]
VNGPLKGEESQVTTRCGSSSSFRVATTRQNALTKPFAPSASGCQRIRIHLYIFSVHPWISTGKHCKAAAANDFGRTWKHSCRTRIYLYIELFILDPGSGIISQLCDTPHLRRFGSSTINNISTRIYG